VPGRAGRASEPQPGPRGVAEPCGALVLRGRLHVEHEGGSLDVRAGQAVSCDPGEWVRYSTPDPEGTECVATCLPAFSHETVHRDAD
jgi:mannose-6-phosphate isomerase-like protein (cupin superfamily)